MRWETLHSVYRALQRILFEVGNQTFYLSCFAVDTFGSWKLDIDFIFPSRQCFCPFCYNLVCFVLFCFVLFCFGFCSIISCLFPLRFHTYLAVPPHSAQHGYPFDLATTSPITSLFPAETLLTIGREQRAPIRFLLGKSGR